MASTHRPSGTTQRMVTLMLSWEEFQELVEVLKRAEQLNEEGRKNALDARMQLYRLEQKTGLKLRK